MLIFCGNNRRQRQLHGWRGHAFANDHLDAFFNPTADAAIALATFVTAAEAAGLGCCPISTVRNHAEDISALIGLPDHVFPLAGVAVGYPSADTPAISMRLPLRTTVHIDRFDDAQIQQDVADYDARRLARAPYAQQRSPERFGTAERYTWSEEKARQYALPERTGFGEFIRRIGFRLD
jgi:nitroreductase/FMN reductase [NAD(P)H]